MANNCTLLVNGSVYGGWTSISIQRGIEQLAGSFSLRVTERWPGVVESRPIQKGDIAVVKIDDVAVCTGYVNRTRIGFDSGSTWFDVEGRDKTADLVDCSSIWKSGQWRSSSVKQIATDLCHPFGIAVVIGKLAEKAAAEKIASFSLEDGETVQDTLERLLRMKALMMWTDGNGNLVINLPEQTAAETALVQGENMLQAEAAADETEQFSQYTVKGQARGVHNAKGEAKDGGVKRYRPLVILAEDHGTTPQKRAKHEQTMREGKSDTASVTVQSWRQAGDNGGLWLPGLRVLVKAPYLHKDNDEMIISDLEYRKDDGGTITRLNLTNPKAYDRLSEQPPKKKTPAKKKKASTKTTSKKTANKRKDTTKYTVWKSPI